MRNNPIVQKIDHSKAKARIAQKLALAYTVIILMLLYAQSSFGDLFKFVSAVVFIIWVSNIYFYFKIPILRKETLHTARSFTFGYLLALIIFQLVLQFFWNLKPTEINESLDPSIIDAPATISMSLKQMLGTAFYVVSISVPAGFFLMLWQKRKQYVVPHENKILQRYRKL